MTDKLPASVVSIHQEESLSIPQTPREMVQGLAGVKMTREGIARANAVLDDPRVRQACRTDQELNRAVGQVGDDLRKQWSWEQARLSEDVTVVLTHGGKVRITRDQYLKWLRAGFLSG